MSKYKHGISRFKNLGLRKIKERISNIMAEVEFAEALC